MWLVPAPGLLLLLSSFASRSSWLAITWQGGHVGGQYNRIFSRSIYMKIEFSSQKRKMHTTTHTTMSMRQGLIAGFAKMKDGVDKFRPNTSQTNCFEGFWRITSKMKAKIEVRKEKKSLCAIRQVGYVMSMDISTNSGIHHQFRIYYKGGKASQLWVSNCSAQIQ